MFNWLIGISLGVSLLAVSAGMGAPLVNMAAAALVGLAIALIAVRENHTLRSTGSPEGVVAASTARHMGYIWSWGALSLFVIYTSILSWKEWLVFFMAFAVAAVLCLFVANSLQRDAEAGRTDPTMTNVARYLTIAQLVGMVATMIGLVVDKKMIRFTTEAGRRIGWQDWAANNIFFFGALALAIVSAYALRAKRNS
jgi:hypothetical protein